MFYANLKKNICCLSAFILSFANASNLDQSKNLSFGKELRKQKLFTRQKVHVSKKAYKRFPEIEFYQGLLH